MFPYSGTSQQVGNFFSCLTYQGDGKWATEMSDLQIINHKVLTHKTQQFNISNWIAIKWRWLNNWSLIEIYFAENLNFTCIIKFDTSKTCRNNCGFCMAKIHNLTILCNPYLNHLWQHTSNIHSRHKKKN